MARETRTTSSADFDGVSVHSGFPNPALDSSLESLDLNQLLIQHPSATFCMKIEGDQWAAEGIFDGDVAVVDRVLTPKKNDKVVWIDDDQFAVSARHQVPGGREVWGTVTAIIHRFIKPGAGGPGRENP